MRSTFGILAILGFLNIFCQGQDYIYDDQDNGRYILQQQTSTDSSIPFHQFATFQQGLGIQPSADFYVPSDLQTSDLPHHLQQTLLQYRPQKTSENDNFQNKISNAAEPFRSNDYVKPSTHRPNYSYLLSHRNVPNSLQTSANDLLESSQLANDTLDEYDENTFDTEQNEQKVIGSAKNVSNTKPDKNSILENFGPSNSLDFPKSTEEHSRHNRQDLETDNNPTEEYEVDTEPNQIKSSEEKPSDKEDQNYIDDEEYDDEYLEEEDEENSKNDTDYDAEQVGDKQTNNKTVEILTLKPMVTTQDDAYNDFVDTDSMDTTTQEPASSDINTQSTAIISNMQKEERVTEEQSKPSTMEATMEKYFTDEKNSFPEYVVSVVTSKTIVNNTYISPVATQLATSAPITANDHKEETSTDSWIVVASVQTSKSISGARYLPSSVVEQLNINKSLAEPESITKNYEIEDTVATTTSEIFTTNLKSSTKYKTSTESLIDKLDRVQSDLSSGLLAGGFKNENIAVIDENTPMKLDTITEVKPTLPTMPLPPSTTTTSKPYPQVKIRKFSAENRPIKPKTKEIIANRSKPIYTTTARPTTVLEDIKDSSSIFKIAKPVDDLSALLPPNYKPPKPAENNNSKILKNADVVDDISAFLPSGYSSPKPLTSTEGPLASILAKAKPVEDISALLPPGFKPPPSSSEKPVSDILAKAIPVEDISSLLPPGFKVKNEESNISKEPKSEHERNNASKVLSKATPVTDITSLLPPGFKQQKPIHVEKSIPNILAQAVPVDDISALLPPGYRGSSFKKAHKGTTTTTTVAPPENKSKNILNDLLPPGYNLGEKNNESPKNLSSTNTSTSDTISNVPAAKSKEVKLVFPSRPGGGSRKTSRLTTARTPGNTEMSKAVSPTIQKGWPVRSSTEFTGWPSPPTTPISIEKLLEAARAAATSTSTASPSTASPTTTTTRPTTTTPKPTTPGICAGECDLAGTIKLVGGVKWVPELLDRNTKEYQILANDVEDELENLYSSSPLLKNWYRKIRIDGFSEGSVLVDYLVELSEVGNKVNTQEIKHLFHESLSELTQNRSDREGKSLNETKPNNKVSLGNFELDPKFTDFVVIPKQSVPTTSYGDDNVLLPQWAIAVIVIGLASLLFVIIFGVTVLVNRHKNSKKTPAPLTEDMLNELNKNHMGGIENYEVDDFYNLDDVWSDKPYEQKPHKKRTNDSIYDNSMSNLYDSWRSQWNGSYDNRYDGNISNNQHAGYNGSRRPKYDTNF